MHLVQVILVGLRGRFLRSDNTFTISSFFETFLEQHAPCAIAPGHPYGNDRGASWPCPRVLAWPLSARADSVDENYMCELVSV